MGNNPNWGGKRPGAGRPRKYVRIEKLGHTELTERELITPESDLTFCIAEMDVDEGDIRRGIVIGEIWYGASEAFSIARLIEQRRLWLAGKE